MNIVFIDPKCPSPYDTDVMRSRALGGTESTVVRIAQGLSQQHTVQVVQHNRQAVREENPNLHFLPLSGLDGAVKNADHIVFIQKAQYIDKVVAVAKGRLWLWLHNYLAEEVPFFWQDHLRYKLGIICVSKTHAMHTRRHIRSLPGYWASMGLMGRGGLLYHYNPLDDAIQQNPGVVRDLNKLVFFSSPHKGIEHVVALFKEAYAKNQNLKLYVADPGYLKNIDTSMLDTPGVVRLGNLPQHAVLKHVQEALCVFYPQRKRPETFGLVYAEANALGTPVLAHDFGAAAEVLVKNNPPMDTRQSDVVVDTLLAWSQGASPVVQANQDFAMAKVVNGWNQFLLNPSGFIHSQNIS
jgi:glycosyltransferase involved in cell wall biosynthesis